MFLTNLIPLLLDDLPDGLFSIDECQQAESTRFKQFMACLAQKNRSFCLSAQSYGALRVAVDVYRAQKNAKRMLLVVVGGKTFPSNDLRAIPRS